MKRIFALTLAIMLLLAFGTAHAAQKLNGAGASFPYPVYSGWAYMYHQATKTQVNYQSIGSGGGIRQISERTVDFGASDAPLTKKELDEKKLYQFPAVIGGVVPVVNIKGIKDGQLKLDATVLCRIFLGEIKTWNNPAITSMNEGVKLPGDKITVVHRSDGSGTTAIFTTYMAEVCPAWRDRVGAGKAIDWPAGIGGKGNEGVANYVKRSKSSIGYVEFAYAKQNKLASVRLKNQAGNFVAPSMDTFKDAAGAANFDPAKHFDLWLVNSPGKKAWPIAGATFILLAREKADANRKTVQFYDWAFRNGDKSAEKLVYVPLPESLKDKIRAYWKGAGIY
jgi:phosphate transport system substrate-binding protein